MYTNYDYEEDRQQEEDRVNQFFGEFSSEIRNKLMSKNLVKPQSLYDVFYPSIKNDLMSKNVNLFNVDLDEFSKEIRDQQLSKAVDSIFSLEEMSADFRKSMMARENLHKETDALLYMFEKKRRDLLARNHEVFADLLKDSESTRRNALAKNKDYSDSEKQFNYNQDKFRAENLSKNIENGQDLENDSKDFRKAELSTNVSNSTDLERDSIQFRDGEMAANTSKSTNLEIDSVEYRNSDLSKNTPKVSDLELDSQKFREGDLSNNVSKSTDLEVDSVEFRKTDLSYNKSKDTDLERDSNLFRKEQVSNNVLKDSDLETDSVNYRIGDVSLNKSKETDLERDSLEFRKADLSLNSPIHNDLELDSIKYRQQDLSNNVSNGSDLEKDSAHFRNEDLSNNISKVTDILLDSKDVRNGNLSNNVEKETDLEKDSKPFRDAGLSYNVEKKTDLIKDSEDYRNNDLSLNMPVVTDLLTDSNSFRNGDLAQNTPIVTNLETDSIPYRTGDLAQNTPIVTDLQTDSVPYRNQDLSQNTPVVTNLETDSVPYRAGDLAQNIPTGEKLDLHHNQLGNLSTPATEKLGNTSKNIPTGEILDSHHDYYGGISNPTSEKLHNTNKNVPSSEIIDLHHDINGALNNPTSEKKYNTNRNVPSLENIDSHKDVNGNLNSATSEKLTNKARNVPTGEILDLHKDVNGAFSSPISEREKNVTKNVKSEYSIDAHYDNNGDKNSASNERIKNLVKNGGPTQLGFNVLGPGGTAIFVGVSGVYMQGLIFRNLLKIRNRKYKRETDGSPDSDYYINNFTNITTASKDNSANVRAINLKGSEGSSFSRKNKYIDGGIGGVDSKFYTEAGVYQYGKGGMLLQNTLAVPSISKIINFEALPMNPVDTINNGLSFYRDGQALGNGYSLRMNNDITSPIERNLKNAYESAFSDKYFLNKFYSIDFAKKINIDYDLNNRSITGKNFGFKNDDDVANSEYEGTNINRLIREYLKYSNAFALDDKGSVKKDNFDKTPADIYKKIEEVIKGGGTATDSISDLINSYKAFGTASEEHRQRLDIAKKSLTSPTEGYFTNDVDSAFDGNYRSIDKKNIAFKTTVGNPTHEEGFDTYKKGVRKILRDISKSDIDFAENYKDIQGVENAKSKKFVIGFDSSKKTKRIGYQKYTIKNPYAPVGAGNLVFCLQNYSVKAGNEIPNIMYFPPYITNFQNSDSVNWNATNFLGRPEAVYTYNNSSRDGSISFFVLTDYAEQVTIGTSQDENMELIEKFISTDFTKKDAGQKLSSKILAKGIEAVKRKAVEALQENKKKVQQELNNYNSETPLPKTEADAAAKGMDASTVAEREDKNAEFSDKISSYESLIAKTEAAANNALKNLYSVNYTETSSVYDNIYNFYVTVKGQDGSGNIDTKLQNTSTRINEMVKNLAFQPAYFSGSKVDFKARMEFLARMTRPAKHSGDIGFSFTTPPVCHLTLGNWIDHDIIVNSISYDYTDAPWTFDNTQAGTVQPMWANVSISFNIIGPAGGGTGVPLTSSDIGFFGNKTTYGS